MTQWKVWLGLACLSVMCATMSSPLLADAYDPPANYYNAATGTGATLKSQLTSIMSSGHIQRRYGDYRYMSVIIDADPNMPGNILGVYDRASIPGAWAAGTTWNREHVWPQSRQPGSASNSTKGNLGDPFSLRPATPSVNGSRSNKPFGLNITLGTYRSLGTYWFTGDADKGDIARACFYSDTRWTSLGLSLVNGVPSGYSMGDLASLLRWNFTDPPDTFERHRNQAIYSSALNPTYYTNNRNAYIDHPEFVWSIYGGGANNSTLFVGAAPSADGGSSVSADLGRTMVGTAMPSDVSVTLQKSGADPAYFSVTAAGDATSSINGRYNAFDYNAQSRSIEVGLVGSTASAGLLQGTVTIDNLQITSGGTGQGVADVDDVISVQLQVLDPSQPSLADDALVQAATYDIELQANDGVQTFGIDVFNLDYNSDQAKLDLDAVSPPGGGFAFVSGLASNIGAGAATLTFSFDTTGVFSGPFSASTTIDVSDEDIPGAQSGSLAVTLQIAIDGATGDWDQDGTTDLADYAELADCLSGPETAPYTSACLLPFDSDGDGDVDLADVNALMPAFSAP